MQEISISERFGLIYINIAIVMPSFQAEILTT